MFRTFLLETANALSILRDIGMNKLPCMSKFNYSQIITSVSYSTHNSNTCRYAVSSFSYNCIVERERFYEIQAIWENEITLAVEKINDQYAQWVLFDRPKTDSAQTTLPMLLVEKYPYICYTPNAVLFWITRQQTTVTYNNSEYSRLFVDW